MRMNSPSPKCKYTKAIQMGSEDEVKTSHQAAHKQTTTTPQKHQRL